MDFRSPLSSLPLYPAVRRQGCSFFPLFCNAILCSCVILPNFSLRVWISAPTPGVFFTVCWSWNCQGLFYTIPPDFLCLTRHALTHVFPHLISSLPRGSPSPRLELISLFMFDCLLPRTPLNFYQVNAPLPCRTCPLPLRVPPKFLPTIVGILCPSLCFPVPPSSICFLVPLRLPPRITPWLLWSDL